jgi:hypothetical protein
MLEPRPAIAPLSSKATRHRTRLIPWLILLLLGLVHFGTSTLAANANSDIKDTHQRLDQIYRKLGLRSEKQPESSDQGCRCLPRDEQRSQPLSRSTRSSPNAAPSFLAYLLVGIVLLLVLWPLYAALRGTLRRTAPPVTAEPEPTAPTSKSTAPSPWRVDLGSCRQLISAGQLAEAYAALHRFTLLGLAAGQWLVLDESTTNWEYVRLLQAHLPLQEVLASVTLAAEQAVLGKIPPPVDHYWLLEQRVSTLPQSDPR